MRVIWATLVAWFERGDLVPLLIVVSAAHYTSVLAGHDAWPVAVAIGVLVDLGHYRWVRAAARYDGARKAQLATRWAFAIVMTAVSLAYHWRYYDGDVWLSAPMPLLIASLAWLAQVDRKHTSADSQVAVDKPQAQRYTCAVCGASYASSQALAGHARKHKATRRNGHEKERIKL